MIKQIVIFLVLAILLIGGSWWVVNQYQDEKEVDEENIVVMTLEINPNLLFMVDENDEIIDYQLINEEAYIAFFDEDFVGQDIGEVTEEIIDTAIDMGYLDEFDVENDILIQVDSEEMREKIQERVSKRLEERKVIARLAIMEIDQSIVDTAREKEISVGKEIAIRRAMAMDESLDESDLLDMSMREIMQLMGKKVREKQTNILERYQVEEMQILRERVREETTKIRENVVNSITDFNELTEEERAVIIEERREQIRETIRDTLEEIKTEYGDSVRDLRDVYEDNEARELNQKIIEETNVIRERVLQNDYISNDNMREITSDIREKVTDYYQNNTRESLDDFRERVTEEIANRWRTD